MVQCLNGNAVECGNVMECDGMRQCDLSVASRDLWICNAPKARGY